MKKAPNIAARGYTDWMEWLLAIFVKPFFAVAFFMLAWAISRLLWRIIPDGKIKKALYSPPPWLRNNGS